MLLGDGHYKVIEKPRLKKSYQELVSNPHNITSMYHALSVSLNRSVTLSIFTPKNINQEMF